MSEIVQRKRLLRRATLAARGRMSEEARKDAAEAAARRVLDLPGMAAARVVLAFASFGHEVDTDPIVSALFARGVRVLMPYVEGDRLCAAAIESLGDLAPGYKGIREPQAVSPEDPHADVILVPGVAFDASGRRLGYGGGFYDGFLSESKGTRVGLCFDCQIVDLVPSEERDQPVNIVVSELRTILCQGS
ncbi:MAG: 5-formyltetrahydrofolate cyclo-ligase [Actinomycetota bacterium]